MGARRMTMLTMRNMPCIRLSRVPTNTLLSESLDDYVTDTTPVRVVDVFVDELDLVNLGFEGAIPADTGRPAYHPRDLAEDLHLHHRLHLHRAGYEHTADPD